jgi:hypothetical protein
MSESSGASSTPPSPSLLSNLQYVIELRNERTEEAGRVCEKKDAVDLPDRAVNYAHMVRTMLKEGGYSMLSFLSSLLIWIWCIAGGKGLGEEGDRL